MEDWKLNIVTLVYVRDQLMKADKEQVWEYYWPEVAATKNELRAIQKKLNINLSKEYQDFLLHANGWECFFQNIDLFGTSDFDSNKMAYARELLSVEMVYNEDLQEMKDYLFPIAVSRDDMDLFVMVLKKGDRFGEVIWLAGGEIDKYESFTEFFLAMIEYNKLGVEDMRKNESR